MGGAKDAMIRDQENVEMATGYLVDIGRLDVCDGHGMVYGGGNGDLDGSFYAQVMNDRNKGDKGPIPWAAEMEAREFTDLLLAAYNEHCADECTHPAHYD